MDLLSVTASIIAVLQLSMKVLGYLNDVKDASKDRAKCMIETSNVHGLLTRLRFLLEEENTGAPWKKAVRELGVKNGPLDQFKQALEALQTHMTDGGRLQQAGKALMWKFKKEEIADILVQIEHLKTLVGIAIQMDHFKLSQAIQGDTKFVRTRVSAIHSGVDQIQQGQADAKRSKILEWISPTNYPAQQSDIIARRQEGTGKWFLKAPEFAGWLGEPKGTLFCPGIPGAGKTMVAAIAIDHLLHSTQSSSTGVAYVYCNYKDQEEQDTSRMLAAIVKQLVQRQPPAAEPVERLHKKHHDLGTKPTIEEIFSTLREVIAKYSTVYLVIDALDECRDIDGTRSQLLTRLRDLQIGQDVRIIATARFIPEIEAEFQAAMKLEIRASDDDVRCYVTSQMHRLPRCIQRDPALQATVQDELVEAVDGMFLLARLHTDSLLDKRTVKEVKFTLGRLLKGSATIDDAYDEAIQRINGQLDGDKELAKKVLSWITHTKRPLLTAELCCALAVGRGETELDPEGIPYVEDLLSVCAGLVVVDPETDVIRLVHYTTQEYFERIRDAWNPGAQLHISSTCLTYLSFSIFKMGGCSSDEEFEERLRGNQFLDYAAKHWGDHALAVEDKTCELACVVLSCEELVSCAVQVLLRPEYIYPGYSQKYPKDNTGLHLTARFGLAIISEALLLNQVGETELILERRDSDGRTPLYLAAELGHQRMVKLLLEKGAEVNAQSGKYGNALQAAVAGNHTAVVELLLNNGADVSQHDSQGRCALHHAIDRVDCNLSLIGLLISRGAPANTADINNMTPLHYCVKRSHKSIIGLLLDNGLSIDVGVHRKSWPRNTMETDTFNQSLVSKSEPDIPGTSAGLTPLHFAALTGNSGMTEFLLERGADPNALSRYDESPMHLTLRKTLHGPRYNDDWANEDFWIEILWELVGIVEEDEFDEISANIAEHREGVLDALLADARTSLTIRDCQHDYPLHCVGFKDPSGVLTIQKLVSRGANLLERNLKQQNALHLACKAGKHDAVTVLISLGVDPFLTDNEGLNALHYAARSGNHETISVLLETTVATRPSLAALKDNQGRNPLHHLVSAHSVFEQETIQLVLNKGADGSELDASGNSPLAIYFKQPHLFTLDIKISQQLLSVKGSSLFVDKYGQHLGHLCTFARRCSVQIFEILKEHGVDLAQKDLQSKTILHCSAIRGSITKKSLHYLLHVVGIEINAKDASGKTALQYAAEKARQDHHPDLFDRRRWDRSMKLLLESGAS